MKTSPLVALALMPMPLLSLTPPVAVDPRIIPYKVMLARMNRLEYGRTNLPGARAEVIIRRLHDQMFNKDHFNSLFKNEQ